jgi:polyhydroxyalkanoate synthesis regulator phasin
MRKTVLAVALVLCVFGSAVAWAGEMDVLVNKLVEKGVLSASEGQIILDETKADVAKQNAKGENEAIPKWIQNTKLGGDFRLRYQYNHTNDSLNDRHRGRIKLRLGIDGKVNDKLMVGVGLATGLNSTATTAADRIDAVRSTNASFDDSFAKKPFALDYAYAKYTPYSWVEFIGGKFKNPLWMPTDLVWDGDINPEGGSINLKKELNSKLSVFLNTGIFVLDESNSAGFNDDPMMYVVQPGFKYKATEKVSVKGAVTYNNSSNVKGRALFGTAGTNTLSGTNLRYDYIVLEPAMEISIAEPLKSTGLPLLKDAEVISLFGQYVNNSIPSDENNGFAVGFNLGAKKVAKFGDWQFKYIYAMLEKDAVLDILPDSDRFGGRTGIRAHEGIFTFGLSKNTSLGLDIYRGWAITNSKRAETLVQVDWNMKF